jgi:integrase
VQKGVEWEMLERSPFDKGKSLRLKENNERLRFLNEAEIDRLIDSSPPYLRHFIIFCIHTGARKQEAVNLKWHQIKNGHVYFEKTKTDNPRQVPIDEDLQELLDQLRSKPKNNVVNISGESIDPVKNQSDYVFLHKGKPFAPHAIQAFFKAACGRAKIPYGIKTLDGVTIHTLRHTFGSWLAIGGIPIRTIQVLMGHKSLSMTMRYAHLTDDVTQEAVTALNGLTSKKECHKTVTRGQVTENIDMQVTENTPVL